MPGSGVHIAARIVIAVAGGYAATSGLIAFLAMSLPPLTGIPRSEAVVLSSMVGFVLYLGLLLWGFAVRRLVVLLLALFLLSAGSFGLVAIINHCSG
jgi:hypothetical protein